MSKFTKSPWYVAAPDKVRGQEPRIRDYMPAIRDSFLGKEICILTRLSTSNLETIANAHLIAAAPKMLDRLEKANELLHCLGDDPAVKHQITQIEALIKEARGEL